MSPRLVLAASAVLAVAALGGCSDEASRSPAAPAPSASAPTATLQLAVAPEWFDTWQAVATAYADSGGAAAVEVVPVPDADDRLALLGEEGGGPDLVLLRDDEYAQVAGDDVLQPLQGLLERRGTDPADYQPLAVDAFTRRRVLQCMPVDASPLVVYVRRDLLESALGTLPTDGWSVEQLVAAARAVVSEDVDGVAFPASLDSVAALAWSTGAEVVDDPRAPTRLTLSDRDTRAVVGLLASLPPAGLTPDREELDEADAVTRFADGRLAMLVGDRSLVPLLRARPDLDVDVVPLPALEEPASVVHPHGLCLDATTPDASAAADFVAFAAGPDGQVAAARVGATVPVLPEVAASDAFLDPTVVPQHSSVFLDALPGSRSLPVVPGWAEVDRLAGRALLDTWFGAGTTAAIDRTVADLESRTRRLLDRR